MQEPRVLYYVEFRSLEEDYSEENYEENQESKNDKWTYIAGAFFSKDDAYEELEKIKIETNPDTGLLRVGEKKLYEDPDPSAGFSSLDEVLTETLEELERVSLLDTLYAYPHLAGYFKKEKIYSLYEDLLGKYDISDLESYWQDFDKKFKERNNRTYSEFRNGCPSLYFLFSAISNAHKFINFTSYGISQIILGALMAASTRGVCVRGIVTNVTNSDTIELARNFRNQNGNFFKVMMFEGEYSQSIRLPHSKLMIVDGLFSFKGSANFTISAMEKSDQNLEIFETTTDKYQIRNLNNIFFSYPWERLTEEKMQYELYITKKHKSPHKKENG